MNTNARIVATLLGPASLLTVTTGLHAQNQQTAQLQTAASEQLPEQVLVTGSLIHGTPVVGVPVTTLSDQDFSQVGAVTTADLLKTVPAVTVLSSVNVINTGGNVVGGQTTSIHNIGGDTTGPKTLLLVDGNRVPFQSTSLCVVDPSIIPQLAIDRLDVLADGASATYGSDAVAGVLNIVLKRGYDGAMTRFQVADSTDIGGLSLMGSQLFGRTWDSGDITITYEGYHKNKVEGPGRPYLTYDYSLWGLDNRTPLVSAAPGIASVGKPKEPAAAPVGFDPSYGTSCNTCYSIPKGQNGVGLTWASILANPGVGNEYNPYDDAWFFPDSTRNAAVVTFDQNVVPDLGIVKNIQFFADGYYNNRRQIIHSAGTTGPAKSNALELAVPTINPFYPIGAPSGLMVAYNFSKEILGYLASGEEEGRWEGGFNFDLPFEWKGKISYTRTEEHAFDSFSNLVNPNLASAALGNVVPSDGFSASYTKPANIPFLNVFCDPTDPAFTCNSPATLAYISSHRAVDETQFFDETNGTIDGALFDLPGGPVRGAIGGDYLTEHYNFFSSNGSTSLRGDVAPGIANDSGSFDVWAAFGQLNIPIVGDANSFLFFRRLEIELSGRIDRYTNVGSTKNPKAALNWDVGGGLTLRGTTGTSFRAPTFNEISTVAGPITPVNVAGGDTGNTEPTCPVVGQPAKAGTAAAVLDPNCTAALQYLGGISLQGGAGAAAGIFGPGHELHPETARNWATGFDYSPDYLKGFNLSADLYYIKIDGIIQSLNRGTGLDDPFSYGEGFWILKTDPNFSQYVQAIVQNPNASPLINPNNISFIEYRLKTNVNWRSYEGFDFDGSYNIDLGDFGAWNTGIAGNYIIDRITFDGVEQVSDYTGKDSGGRLNYRARLGWAGGTTDAFSATLFMNYMAHYGNQEAGDNIRAEVLPPSCFMIGNPACNSSGLPQFAQYTQQYTTLTNYEPARITFDLTLGYQTGNMLANTYLRNISFQLAINNILNKKPDFAYQIAFSGGSPRAFDDHQDPAQRVVVLTITKVW